MKKIFSFVIAALFSVALFADTYSVVGASADIFGGSWDLSAHNDMTADGNSYKWVKTDVSLDIAEYQFKIVKNHSWTNPYPAGMNNSNFVITKKGTYDLTFVFEISGTDTTLYAKAEAKSVTEYASTIEAKGSWNDWKNGLAFTIAEDKKTASAKINLTAQEKNYEFKLVLNSNVWIGNNHEYHREYTGAENINENAGNMKLKVDVTGDYVFTWTFATDGLQITFPTGTAVENVESGVQSTKVMKDGQLYIIKNGETYTVQGQIVK